MGFETNVFINCPFDGDYLPLLRPMLFCVLSLGLEPRIALENPLFDKIPRSCHPQSIAGRGCPVAEKHGVAESDAPVQSVSSCNIG
jgi:hypothetical protein